MKILIAEDDSALRRLLYDQLTGDGYEVVQASDGKEAYELYRTLSPDMAILDVMMPVMDGLSLLTKIRETSDMPVIFLTARGEEIDKVSGLRMGADDYLVKPWGMNELLARIEVQKRHIKSAEGKAQGKENVIVAGNLRMDFANGIVEKDGEVLTLNAKEYHILKFLSENMGKVVTKKQIYQAVWQDDYVYDDNTIMVQISHLRSKIDDDDNKHIATLVGIGYRFG
ncbi:DNA-binding response regulator, OmpR family, contains REC and winged-helix (wHTH) domain [Oscillospiraceae bacterium]|nr:DNA-binding response regulator, OmpR family, contains REC and winged-helix (wHTH) domain [Oscillospiraceae bacterium]